MRFEVIEGKAHVRDANGVMRHYEKGEIVESDKKLDEKFKLKFRRLADDVEGLKTGRYRGNMKNPSTDGYLADAPPAHWNLDDSDPEVRALLEEYEERRDEVMQELNEEISKRISGIKKRKAKDEDEGAEDEPKAKKSKKASKAKAALEDDEDEEESDEEESEEEEGGEAEEEEQDERGEDVTAKYKTAKDHDLLVFKTGKNKFDLYDHDEKVNKKHLTSKDEIDKAVKKYSKDK
jgi:hypothetical protein